MTRKGLINALLSATTLTLVLAALALFVVPRAQKRRREQVCQYCLVTIVHANRMYAHEHRIGYQTNVICLSNELMSPITLLCVDDDAHKTRMRAKVRPRDGFGTPEHWARLTMDDISYEVRLKDSNTLVVRCPIHKISAVDKLTGGGIQWESDGK